MNKSRTGPVVDYGKSLPLGTYSGSNVYIPLKTGEKFCLKESGVALLENFQSVPKPYFKVPPYGYTSKETFWSSDFRRPVWNECVHTKVNQAFTYPYGMVNGGRYGVTCFPCSRETLPIPPDLTAASILEGEVSEFTRARAWASMQPGFSSDFQTLNFIWELKDFREILKASSKLMCGTSAHRFKYLSRHKPPTLEALRKTISPHTGKKISAMEAMNLSANTAAGTWLLNAMMIQPTIKDLIALSSAASTMYLDALNKFKAAGATDQSSHYTEVLHDEVSSTAVTHSAIGGLVQKEVGTKSVWTASLSYNYHYNLDSKRIAFMKYWGLQGTPEEFWNMIPLSFLVDYVCKIGEALRYANRDKYLDLSVLNYSESTLNTVFDRVATAYNPALLCSLHIDGKLIPPLDTKTHPVFGYESSYYVRRLVKPNKIGIIIPRFRGISSSHLTSVAALLKTILF